MPFELNYYHLSYAFLMLIRRTTEALIKPFYNWSDLVNYAGWHIGPSDKPVTVAVETAVAPIKRRRKRANRSENKLDRKPQLAAPSAAAVQDSVYEDEVLPIVEEAALEVNEAHTGAGDSASEGDGMNPWACPRQQLRKKKKHHLRIAAKHEQQRTEAMIGAFSRSML